MRTSNTCHLMTQIIFKENQPMQMEQTAHNEELSISHIMLFRHILLSVCLRLSPCSGQGSWRDHTWMSSDKNSWILQQQRANGITKPVYQVMNTHGLWCFYSWMDFTLVIVIFDDFPGGKSLKGHTVSKWTSFPLIIWRPANWFTPCVCSQRANIKYHNYWGVYIC